MNSNSKVDKYRLKFLAIFFDLKTSAVKFVINKLVLLGNNVVKSGVKVSRIWIVSRSLGISN